MKMPDPMTEMTEKLLAFGKTIPVASLFPTLVPGADELVAKDPYAFAMAVCLDRGTKADIIWTIPYDVRADLGHLDPEKIYKMSLEELTSLIRRLPHKPRYINVAPKTINELTRLVVEKCDGDAANIWRGRKAADVNRTFQSIHGVGPGIASMGVILIEKAFDVRFSDLDRPRMDIKPDVHTMRVLYRIGASDSQTEGAAVAAARALNPMFPGELDGALWEIGRRWCFASNPRCAECPIEANCVKRLR